MSKLFKIQKILMSICIALITMFPLIGVEKIRAAGVSVSASNNGNGTFSIGISTTLTGKVSVNTSNGNSAVYWCESGSCALWSGNSTISGSGSITVTAIPQNPMDDGNGNKVYASGSSTIVNVTSPSDSGGSSGGTSGGGSSGGTSGGGSSGGSSSNTNTPSNGTSTNEEADTEKNDDKDKDKTEDKDTTNKLSKLEVSIGELSPKFDAQTLQYNATVPAGTKKITIRASASSDKASVEGAGEKELAIGDNKFDIICRAENGSATTYHLTVRVNEKPVTTLKYGDKTLGVLSGGATVSTLFEETKIKVNGKEVSAWVNTKLKITLLYMQNEKTGEKDLYMYDTNKNVITSIYRPFAYLGKNLVMIDVPEKLQTREGMKFTTIKLDDYQIPGWEFKDESFKHYAVIYVMDDIGNKVYYQYDRKEKTLQVYSQAAAITQKDYEKTLKQSNLYKMLFICVGALSMLMLVIIIVLIIKRKKHPKYKKIILKEATLSAEAQSLLHALE